MDLQLFNYVHNTGRLYSKAKCSVCQADGVTLMADCQGDSMTFCREHWEEFFDEVRKKLTTIDTTVIKYDPQIHGYPDKCRDYIEKLLKNDVELFIDTRYIAVQNG